MLWWIIAILGIVLLLFVICFGLIFIVLQAFTSSTGLENVRAVFVFSILFFIWIVGTFFTDTLPKFLLWPFRKVCALYEKTKRK